MSSIGHPAVFVVSIDLEMSSGGIHRGQPHDGHPYSKEREIVRDVLNLMEQYRLAGTWAVVGHLFLSACAPAPSGPFHKPWIHFAARSTNEPSQPVPPGVSLLSGVCDAHTTRRTVRTLAAAGRHEISATQTEVAD